jgi:hypothetical protein
VKLGSESFSHWGLKKAPEGKTALSGIFLKSHCRAVRAKEFENIWSVWYDIPSETLDGRTVFSVSFSKMEKALFHFPDYESKIPAL